MKEFFDGFFTPDPGVADGIFALAVLYALAVGPGRRYLAPEKPFERWRAICFGSGVVLLVLAVCTPLDHIGETYLFSAHMVQHVILMFLLPPLFILGVPTWLADFLFRTEGLGKLLKLAVHPIVAGVMFNAALIIWHIPAFYELALRDPFMHLVEHATFVLTSIAMFWVLIGTETREEPMHDGLKLLYILAVNIGQIPLFAALSFASSPLYPTYARAPRYFETLTPLADQVLGGVIMKLCAAVFMFGGLVVFFYRWYSSDDTFGRK